MKGSSFLNLRYSLNLAKVLPKLKSNQDKGDFLGKKQASLSFLILAKTIYKAKVSMSRPNRTL